MVRTAIVAVEEGADPAVLLGDVKASMDPLGSMFEPFAFAISNRSPKPITAAIVQFRLESEDGASVAMSQSSDFLLGSTDILPGERRVFENRGAVASNQTSRIVKVSAQIAFLEFADGTTAGEGSAVALQNFEKARNQHRNYYRAVVQSFDEQQTGSEADRLTRALDETSAKGVFGCQVGGQAVRELVKAIGVSRTLDKLRTPRQLPGRR